MHTLRLTHRSGDPGRHQVDVVFEKADGSGHTAISQFSLALSAQDQEDLRWYLEDYLQYPLDPAPSIARRIERRMEEIGQELFRSIFQENNGAGKLWAATLPLLNNTRVEIATQRPAYFSNVCPLEPYFKSRRRMRFTQGWIPPESSTARLAPQRA